MKKIISLALIFTLALICLVACGGKETEYKLGFGVSVSLSSSTTGNAQADANFAAVVLDSNGKIVDCKIDLAQNKVSIEGGVLTESVEFKTQMEKGDAYGMKEYSSIQKEWWEQVNFLSKSLVGKTVADVKALALNGEYVANEEILAGCTIGINGLVDAVVRACEDAYAKTFTASGDFTLGIGAVTQLEYTSTSASAESDGSVTMYTDFAATVTGADGKILAAIVDVIKPNITFNAAGEITSDTTTAVNTNREAHDNYNMKDVSGIGKEWWEQADHFTSVLVGKTVAEIGTLDAADATITAGCTINVSGFFNSVDVALNGYGK